MDYLLLDSCQTNYGLCLNCLISVESITCWGTLKMPTLVLLEKVLRMYEADTLHTPIKSHTLLTHFIESHTTLCDHLTSLDILSIIYS